MHSTRRFLGAALVATLSLPAAAQVKDYRDIKYPALAEFTIPRPDVHVLGNGMKVFLMEDHELPLINIETRIRTGSNYDPAAKVGLGNIFGQVQREGGAGSMSGNAMDAFLEARAASIETGMSGDVGFASMDCLKDNFDDVLGLYADVLRRPQFEEDKLELAKVQVNTGISRRNDAIAGIAGREFSRLIYGPDSALGRQAEYSTIEAIERADLIAWHKRYYHPNNVWLGVVGDFDSAEMLKKIEKAFGDWPKGPEFDAPAPDYAMVSPGVYFIAKEDVTQAYVRIGHLGIEQKDPDYFAVRVMNEIFGGGFAARLFSNVRSKKGLAYSVSGGIGADFVRPGVFQVGLSTKSETMAASVDALRVEIDAMIAAPPSKDEMAVSKEAILNSFVFNYASRDQILSQQMLYDYYGLPADWLDSYRARIEAVTAADVARVAKKYMHPDQTVLLVVGKPADFDRPVDSFGEVTQIDISIPPPPDRRGAIERNAGSLRQGGELFGTAARRVQGGGPIESAKASFKVTIDIGGQQMQLGQEIAYTLPNQVRSAFKTPMGDQITVVNGDEGFAIVGGQTRSLPQDRSDELLETLSRNLLVLTRYSDSPELEAVAGGEDEVDGASCHIVSVTYHGAESRLCIDGGGLVIKQSYQGKHPLQGTPGLIEVVFADYSDIEGRQIPHTQVMSFEGQKVATMVLDSIALNPQIDPATFAPPN